MAVDYHSYLEDLREDQEFFNILPQPPCHPEQVECFAPDAQEEFGTPLPPEYLEFLGSTNGFAHNGSFFFAADAENPDEQNLPPLLGQNAQLRDALEAAKNYIIFGHSSLWYYGWRISDGTWHALDLHGFEPAEQFASFNDMMVAALHECLNVAGDEDSPPVEGETSELDESISNHVEKLIRNLGIAKEEDPS